MEERIDFIFLNDKRFRCIYILEEKECSERS